MTMWVDKYRPKKFSDLLGEDVSYRSGLCFELTPQRVHRDVMAWLKEWDRCVFKRIPPRKRKVDDEENKFVCHSYGRYADDRWTISAGRANE